VTGCWDVLNGYQKGKCFYCFADVAVQLHSALLADVDHFVPWVLVPQLPGANVDGVWNLVFAPRVMDDIGRQHEGARSVVRLLALGCSEGGMLKDLETARDKKKNPAIETGLMRTPKTASWHSTSSANWLERTSGCPI
jgi:hypothetical protein